VTFKLDPEQLRTIVETVRSFVAAVDRLTAALKTHDGPEAKT
jgi:hypothetical protein